MDLVEKQVSTESVYDGALLHVRRDMVEVPDGGKSVREWIDHPGAAAIVPVFDDGTTLLVRQFRYPARKVFWEVPAGKLDIPGEAPESVAKRELEEETGWVATRCEHIGSCFPCIGYSNEVIHLYLAFGLSPGTQNLGDGELVDPVRMPFESAMQMIFSGEIDDMKTISAILLAARKLGKLV